MTGKLRRRAAPPQRSLKPLRDEEWEREVGLLLLAAGGSRRLGEPKQLLVYEGETLLCRAARTALASLCHPVIVVLGASAPAEHVRSQEIGREVKATIVGWINEFRQKRQAETARGISGLFSEVVRSPDPQST